MAMTVEKLKEAIEQASAPGFRGRMLARGQARSIIWRDGELPSGAPYFTPRLSYDLLSYGFSVLGMGLRLQKLENDSDVSRQAFKQAADAIESVISRGDPEDERRGFHRITSAAAYHLGKFSARSYSLLVTTLQSSNLSPIEHALALLMLRDFNGLMEQIRKWRLDGLGDDEQVLALLEKSWQQAMEDNEPGVSDGIEAVDHALTDNFLGALATYLLALESGNRDLVENALNELRTGFEICSELNLVPQWWVHRLTLHLLDDLWSSTLHVILPGTLPNGDEASWRSLRRLFISLLGRRTRAEIDLWPSQIEGASRSIDQADDLVVSLPTSAGKTRIAELCILRCLSEGKRVIFVTPLRALAAQTEVSLRETFLPLGKTISTLYGSIGTSGLEQDVLRARDIIVGTPEKLDFALRNDPSIIDDVGLVVLDEGHMIGLGEREVRYEVQIQRLLRRNDADQRRIVCLSAVLPHGEQLDDFVSWLKRDRDGAPVESNWRPTRLRYGEVVWERDHARLNLRVDKERPFVPNYFGARKPDANMRRSNKVGVRREVFPRDQQELVLATTWKLVQEGQTVLIYCPERRSVEPYAREIPKLYLRGLLDSVLEADAAAIAPAKLLGEEWLGENHPIIRCLELGIAIHHGALPTPFRKEIEKLLREGILKITVSSPTLAQGLNLSATAIVMHDIEYFDRTKQNRELIKPSDFHNIIGRAGRAYVDIEGLVLYPIFNKISSKRPKWERLIALDRELDLESGLLRLLVTLLVRLNDLLDRPSQGQLIEYIVNNADAWVFRGLEGESNDKKETERYLWQTYLARLDTAILSLLGESDCEIDDVAAALDEVLNSSLLQRRLARREERFRSVLDRTIKARARYIWGHTSGMQRKGYFLAGVGYDSGQSLDAIAEEANELLVQANIALSRNDQDKALACIIALAQRLFDIPPFAVPKSFSLDNWQEILDAWLRGENLSKFTAENTTKVLQFVEGGLIYRLPWGMEAIRVRAIANGDTIHSPLGDLMMDDYEVNLAVPAVECGTLNRSAALLMQAGFTSRLAAIRVVEETEATFSDRRELSKWLESHEVLTLTLQPNWPTAETAEQWRIFVESFTPRAESIWKEQLFERDVDWKASPPESGTPVRLVTTAEDGTLVLSPSAQKLGQLRERFATEPSGLVLATVGDNVDKVKLTYLGPEDLQFA